MSRLKRDKVVGDWRKLHIEELYKLYSSLIIIRMENSRGMRWVWHVASMGDKRNACSSWLKSQKERDH
jgi:hypothetical protein